MKLLILCILCLAFAVNSAPLIKRTIVVADVGGSSAVVRNDEGQEIKPQLLGARQQLPKGPPVATQDAERKRDTRSADPHRDNYDRDHGHRTSGERDRHEPSGHHGDRDYGHGHRERDRDHDRDYNHGHGNRDRDYEHGGRRRDREWEGRHDHGHEDRIG